MMENPFEWRNILEMIQRDVAPKKVAEELPGMIEWAGGDEAAGLDALIGFTAEFMVVSAGLAAAYVLPPDDPTEALSAVAARLRELDFETGLNELPEDQARQVRRFIEEAKPLYADMGCVMQVVLGAYVRGEYDLRADPNGLVLEAEDLMATNPDGALELLGRAGAMGLRGVRGWWRWADEVNPPLSQWIGLAWHLVDDLTGEGAEPLGPVEEERVRWHEMNAEADARDAEPASEFESDAEEKQADEKIHQLLEPLYKGERALTKSQEQAIAAQRDEVIPHLIELVEDQDLWPNDAPGQGWVPIHAIDLLGKLHANEAVPMLIDTMAASDWEEIIHDRCIVALEEIGAPAAPAVIETVRYTRDLTLKASLASILGKIGKETPGTFDALVNLFEELSWDQERIFAVWGLAELGDRRAIPILEQALQDRKTPPDAREELEGALSELGAIPKAPTPLNLSIRKKYESPLRAEAKKPRPGRNDPCWCGSGKKYKHCHLEADERASRTG